MPDDPDSEILLELNRIGNAMEVRAISVSDGLEVSFTAPANTIQSDVERLARSKLAYVRRKAQGDGTSSEKKPGGKGGLIA
jgi:hypothetical protein